MHPGSRVWQRIGRVAAAVSVARDLTVPNEHTGGCNPIPSGQAAPGIKQSPSDRAYAASGSGFPRFARA